MERGNEDGGVNGEFSGLERGDLLKKKGREENRSERERERVTLLTAPYQYGDVLPAPGNYISIPCAF